LPVPSHLRSAHWREKRDFGTGKGYLYPHDYEGHDVDQQYLPDKLHEMHRRYYYPTEQGFEKRLKDYTDARAERRKTARKSR
jgi:ATPase related to the helicase subunit of the Holliday junction resolvase